MVIPASPALAYLNDAFLTGDAGRPLRVLAEYLQPLEIFEREKYTTPSYFLVRRAFSRMGRWATITRLHGISPAN